MSTIVGVVVHENDAPAKRVTPRTDGRAIASVDIAGTTIQSTNYDALRELGHALIQVANEAAEVTA